MRVPVVFSFLMEAKGKSAGSGKVRLKQLEISSSSSFVNLARSVERISVRNAFSFFGIRLKRAGIVNGKDAVLRKSGCFLFA